MLYPYLKSSTQAQLNRHLVAPDFGTAPLYGLFLIFCQPMPANATQSGQCSAGLRFHFTSSKPAVAAALEIPFQKAVSAD